MKRGNKKLCRKERELLVKFRKEGLGFREIGRRLGRSHTSLSRELKRNSCKPGFEEKYVVDFAESQANFARYRAGRKKSFRDPVLEDYVLQKLKQGLSPNLISGVISRELPGYSVCHETIYKYIYNEHGFELSQYLPTQRPLRQPRGQKRKRGFLRDAGRRRITERRDSINNRQELGHWESDSIVSSKSRVILNVAIERKSRYVQITKVEDSSAQRTYEALHNRLNKHGSDRVKSITFDNGTENADYKNLERDLGVETYFCLPYHSWERASVENINGMIRRFVPKKKDIAEISVEEIQEIEDWLNKRPRKILGYRTPFQDFNSFP